MSLELLPAVLPAGRVFHGRYEVVRCIKAGGMGAIYEVIHLETRRRRALKVMLPSVLTDREMRARFQLEATVAADIETEHIVETFDAGIEADTGAPFLVMELLRGEDLGAVLEREGTLPAEDVVLLLAQAASALDKTHAAGVVHRDLKPENLFVTHRDDGSPKLKILDFGIAKVVSEAGQAAARTKVLGTPLYMSPEQIRGDGTIGPRADLYAVGHIAFVLLVGQAYWAEPGDDAQLYAVMMKIVAGGGPPATAVAARTGVTLPAAFDPWFDRCTAASPADRFDTAKELVEALAVALDVPAARTSTVTALARVPERAPSRAPGDDPVAETRELKGADTILESSAGASLAAAMVPKPSPPAVVEERRVSQASAQSLSGEPREPPRRRSFGLAVVVVAALLGVSAVGMRATRSTPDAAGAAASTPTVVVGAARADVRPAPEGLSAPVALSPPAAGAPLVEASVMRPASLAVVARPGPSAGVSPAAVRRTAPGAPQAAAAPIPTSTVKAAPVGPDDSVLLERK